MLASGMGCWHGRLAMKHAFLILLACLLVVTTGHAFPQYPPAIKSHLGLAKEPGCTTCHQTDPGQRGNASKQFAFVLKQLGLDTSTPDTNALGVALDSDRACNVDSDGDGTLDIVELQQGSDPSDANGEPVSDCGDTSYTGPYPKVGCSLNHNTDDRHWLFVGAFLFARMFSRALKRKRLRE